MDIQNIPKTFWHSLSLAVLVVSVGLTYIAYKSSTVSIKFANATIILKSEIASSTIALTAAIEAAKKVKADTEMKYKKLLKRHDLLKKQLASKGKKDGTDPWPKANWGPYNNLNPMSYWAGPTADVSTPSPSPQELAFDNFDQSIKNAEKSLEKLEALKKQIHVEN